MAISSSKASTINSSVVKDLQIFLANTYLLTIKTQNFHWNVKGPRFHFLHTMFEEQYNSLIAAVDDIAEQIRQLHHQSPGSMQEFLQLTSLKESPGNLKEDEMLEILYHDHEEMITLLKEWIKRAEEHGEEGVADLMVDQLRFHDKTSWMINSHLAE